MEGRTGKDPEIRESEVRIQNKIRARFQILAPDFWLVAPLLFAAFRSRSPPASAGRDNLKNLRP